MLRPYKSKSMQLGGNPSLSIKDFVFQSKVFIEVDNVKSSSNSYFVRLHALSPSCGSQYIITQNTACNLDYYVLRLCRIFLGLRYTIYSSDVIISEGKLDNFANFQEDIDQIFRVFFWEVSYFYVAGS